MKFRLYKIMYINFTGKIWSNGKFGYRIEKMSSVTIKFETMTKKSVEISTMSWRA